MLLDNCWSSPFWYWTSIIVAGEFHCVVGWCDIGFHKDLSDGAISDAPAFVNVDTEHFDLIYIGWVMHGSVRGLCGKWYR